MVTGDRNEKCKGAAFSLRIGFSEGASDGSAFSCTTIPTQDYALSLSGVARDCNGRCSNPAFLLRARFSKSAPLRVPLPSVTPSTLQHSCTSLLSYANTITKTSSLLIQAGRQDSVKSALLMHVRDIV